jgi:subtilisin-like proprotein convertase family protein
MKARGAWLVGLTVGLFLIQAVGAHSTLSSPSPALLAAPSAQLIFSNPSAITIPAAGPEGVASPYPSTIPVAGLSGTVTKVTVTLTNFSHTFPADVDILLVGPTGANATILSDLGGATPVTNVTLTLDDAAATALPTPLVSGTFKPTNALGFIEPDPFPAPAPAHSGASALSVFNGTNPNGTWSLYVVDDSGGDTGSISGGWSLSITGPSAPTATLTPTPTATPTATVTATPTPPVTACILGDINCDGLVDIRDYGLWRQAFGQQGASNPADLNRDSIVDIRDYGLWRANFGQTGATNCIPVGAICRANVSTLVGTLTGTIVLADCANPADPVNCARLVSVANGFTVTGRFGPVSGNFGVNLTIAVVDATTGAPAGTRTVNCPGTGAVCSNTLVSGNVRPQLGGTVVLSTMPVGAPDSTGLHELAGAAPDRDPT